MFTEQILIFQEHYFIGYRTHTDFPGVLFWLSNRYQFSKQPFLNFIEQIGNFQEGTPLLTDISEIGLGGCFRTLLNILDETFVYKLLLECGLHSLCSTCVLHVTNSQSCKNKNKQNLLIILI